MDLIISNCVINLSSDKSRVFNEAFRVLLKPGGAIGCVGYRRAWGHPTRNPPQCGTLGQVSPEHWMRKKTIWRDFVRLGSTR